MYIGVDLGTTACKAALYDSSGQVLAKFNREYPLIRHEGRVEQDASLWWLIVREAIASVADGYGKSVQAISVSTQGISFVPVDRAGNPLYNAVSWLDLRGELELSQLARRFSDTEIYRKTGKHLNGAYTLPKLMWFKNNHPDLYERTDRILMPLDFLNQKLCGLAVADYTMAGGTMLYDLQNKDWDEELLDFAKLDRSKMPEVQCMGAQLGTILPEVASELGLSTKTQIILGGQDQKLAAIGAGIGEGSCTLSLGTSAAVTELSSRFDLLSDKPQFRLNDIHFVKESSVSVSGAAVKWLSHILGDISYSEMDALAEKTQNGAGSVRFNPAFLENASINGITLSTTRGEIVYALYEGIARKIKECVSDIVPVVKVFGGGSKSHIWCKIIARILKKDLEILDTAETASLGAAILSSGFILPYAKTIILISGKEE